MLGMNAKPKKIRLDDLLVERGDFPDRATALRAVMAREVRVDDVYATSAAMKISPTADIFIRGRKQFVSRGGKKLQGALDAFKQDVAGMNCLDIGSSTGGFTDCLLQAGASRVAALDVNYGQLAWKIRQDPRVAVFERTNIKDADPAELGAPFDLIVIDVSFIGLAALAPLFPRFSRPGAIFIGLVKPQFESAHDETDHGVVRDEAVRLRTVEEVKAALAAAGFDATGVADIPHHRPRGQRGIPRPRRIPQRPGQLTAHSVNEPLDFCTRLTAMSVWGANPRGASRGVVDKTPDRLPLDRRTQAQALTPTTLITVNLLQSQDSSPTGAPAAILASATQSAFLFESHSSRSSASHAEHHRYSACSSLSRMTTLVSTSTQNAYSGISRTSSPHR